MILKWTRTRKDGCSTPSRDLYCCSGGPCTMQFTVRDSNQTSEYGHGRIDGTDEWVSRRTDRRIGW